jgi:rhamnogalacturonan endolyase
MDDSFRYSVPRDRRPKLEFPRERVTINATPAEVKVLRPAERIDRGLVALPIDDGKVYLGWRPLANDAQGVAFDVLRSKKPTGPFRKRSAKPIASSTNFVDEATPGQRLHYRVVARLSNGKQIESKVVSVTTTKKGHSAIELDLPNGALPAGRVGIADLDGDGAYDFVVKSPRSAVDPFVWSKSKTTVKLHAIRSDGKHLWTHDMGWNIENGIWFSPYVVTDCDVDGKADVFVKYCPGPDRRNKKGNVMDGPEYLARLDGRTGKVVAKVPWHGRGGYLAAPYGNGQRNFLYAAYVNGKTPSIIMQRGNYTQVKLAAFDNDLKQQWRKTHKWTDTTFGHQGSHWVIPADVDGDGNDELIAGGVCYDEKGQGVWSTRMGHPDGVFVGDIDPARVGLEVYLHYEAAHDKHGWQLTDARTGKLIWGLNEPNTHIHGQGMVADVLPEHPGLECQGKDKKFGARLIGSKGQVLARNVGGWASRTARWDGDVHREVITGGGIVKMSLKGKGKVVGCKPEGRVIAIADILGDWREEIITSRGGKLRIHTTTIPARTRHICLMQDRLYRNYVTNSTMGYWVPPLLTRALSDSSE